MEELKKLISKKWISFGKETLEIEAKSWVDKYEENPFDILPKEIILTSEEITWLEEKESKEEWEGDEWMKMRQLRYKKGLQKGVHELRRDNFQKILDKCKQERLTLPNNFVELIMNDNHIDRFRCSWSEFVNFHKLVRFPNKKNIFLIPFHQDTQGGCVWYLAIDKKGNHLVIYYPTSVSNDYEFEFEAFKQDIFICAESINEFIIRMSFDFQTIEQEKGI